MRVVTRTSSKATDEWQYFRLHRPTCWRQTTLNNVSNTMQR